MAYKKKVPEPQPLPQDTVIEGILTAVASIEDRLVLLEESVAYLEVEPVESEERIIYDILDAVTEALYAINLHSTHAMAKELEEKYFGKEEDSV